MVNYQTHILDNGLTLLTHEAWDTPLATVNLLYNVGSRDEDPTRTGFAHLFEHLMFGGTPQFPDFDAVVSGIGGEDNAFTTCDYTNYYMTVPAETLPVALSLEADRMAHLDISQRALEIQQHVVTEEYNQRYMNQPYGDIWLHLRPLCYNSYPYRWPTIGADIRHVSEATLEDVRSFHRRFYRPDNAILAIAAPLSHDAMLQEVAKAWSAGVSPAVTTTRPPQLSNGPKPTNRHRKYPAEPEQTAPRFLHLQREVPASMVYLAYPMGDRWSGNYRSCDLISDILANGSSSRLHRRLVVEQGLLTEADACISGEEGPGLLVLSGKLQEGVTLDEAAKALRREARSLAEETVSDYELQKVQNKYENTFVFSHYKASDRALALCHYTWLGDTELVNREPEEYHQVTPAILQASAHSVFVPQHENLLYYEKI